MSAQQDLRHVVSDAPRVMVVDGSKLVRKLIGDTLLRELPSARVVGCAGIEDARAILAEGAVDLVTTALVLPRHGLAALRTAHPKFQVSRALFGITTSICAFFCIQSMPLGNFTAIWSACRLVPRSFAAAVRAAAPARSAPCAAAGVWTDGRAAGVRLVLILGLLRGGPGGMPGPWSVKTTLTASGVIVAVT